MKLSAFIINTLQRVYSDELVDMAYRGILMRAADSTGLAAYSKTLRATADLAGLLKELSYSNEHWEKSLNAHAPDLVRAFYQGLLGREPEPEALESYAARLAESHDLTPLLAEIARSDEHWRKTLDARAPDLVRALYQKLLGREPEPEVLQDYAATLAESHDLAPLLAEIARSDEHWEKLLAVRAQEIVEEIYRGLLHRNADLIGLQNYSKILTNPGGLTTILTGIINSDEFRRQRPRQDPLDPSASYEAKTVVFLHIQKAAGTSVQGMLLDSFNKEIIYYEHGDSLYKFSPGELSAYSIFAGHFNYDSLSFIPRRHLSIFTFVREPKKRLISLYYFWRSHEPSSPDYGGGLIRANELSIEEFFEVSEDLTSFGIWNHMTWSIMGQRQWKVWQTTLADASNEGALAEIISNTIRPAIRKRLCEFIFIGLQEDFDRSVRMLFQILQQPQPEKIRADHTLELLTRTDPHFKRSIEKQPMTARLDMLLDRLVVLDNIVYEEAQELYKKRLAEFSLADSAAG